VHEADPLFVAIERDFEFLRHVRGAGPPARISSARPPPTIVTIVRWGLAIVPLALVWGCARLLEFSGGAPRLAALNTLGALFSILILARSQPRIERGRRAALILMGASTGLALAATPFLLLAVQLSQLLFVGLLILWTQPGDGSLGVVLGLVAVGPSAMFATALWDAIRTLRRIRFAPLTWRDTGWIYLGLLPGALAGYLALRAYLLFDGPG
jgi:hypothetical protein